MISEGGCYSLLLKNIKKSTYLGWVEYPNTLTRTYELFVIHYGHVSNNMGGYANGNFNYRIRGSIRTSVIFSQCKNNDRNKKHRVLVLEQMVTSSKIQFYNCNKWVHIPNNWTESACYVSMSQVQISKQVFMVYFKNFILCKLVCFLHRKKKYSN